MAFSHRVTHVEDLKAMVKDAVLCHFDDDSAPQVIKLHLVKQDVIAV